MAASVAALYAIWISPLPLLIKTAVALFVSALSCFQLIMLSGRRLLKHDPQEQLWSVDTTGHNSAYAIRGKTITKGVLVRGGYRSAGLLILVLQSNDSRFHRIVIWRDQLDPDQFSYLHYQLAYACKTASPRSLMAWLRS